MLVQASRWAFFWGWSMTRWLFPKKIEVTEDGIRTVVVQALLMPWVKEEETLVLGRVASVRHMKGVFWDSIQVESLGGTNTLDIEGLRKSDAAELVALINHELAVLHRGSVNSSYVPMAPGVGMGVSEKISQKKKLPF
ncbi:MAG: hypothetical protein KTR14_05300 [Vampirovibrio sp.]|nr:hypothetical protein [Vampirovibrio sp.]